MRSLTKKSDMETSGITLTAAKFLYKGIVERYRAGEDTSNVSLTDLVEEHSLWVADEWSHVGFCIIVCLENSKLIDSYNKGNVKVLDVLIGKTVKFANMTVDPELIKELMP